VEDQILFHKWSNEIYISFDHKWNQIWSSTQIN